MNPFYYQRAADSPAALAAIRVANSSFLAGGTNLVDLMKYGVATPTTLVDINRLDLAKITATPDGGVSIGALVRNSDLANDPLILAQYPLLSQALLSGASPQLRNMATTGGNLLQRTRCYYFMDTGFPACNKRVPGSGCGALKGYNRIHAILGQSDKGAADATTCIATHPSDMCVAMSALDAVVHVQGPNGERTIPIAEFHKLPATTPHIDTALQPGELITHVTLPRSVFAANSHYLKARDRNSYAFALISVAAGVQMSGSQIKSAAVSLGGVAAKPWRVPAADQALAGHTPSDQLFRHAADLLLHDAKPYQHNAFKVEMAKQGVVRALKTAAAGAHA